ncbi:baseplate hub domain-containing protein, partial [Elioraea sp.]|uniref:baseplate hub domain-containing protein n=1 Tax=Elioraea sp. TaxID=2185103 RepID=UPI003F7056BA
MGGDPRDRGAAVKSVSSALAAHLAGALTTLATCWRVARRDGTLFGFTDHDRDLVVDGLTYRARTGYR